MRNKVKFEELNNFWNYVMSFYNDKNGIYPIKNLTLLEVITATNIYISKLDSLNFYNWGGGDSIDRERVRDIINLTRRTKNGN